MNLRCIEAIRQIRLRRLVYAWKDLVESAKTMWRFRKVVWNYRYWDYSHQLDIIEHMLVECERKWGVETNYVGDKFTLGRIRVLLKNLQEYKDSDKFDKEDAALKKFLSRYIRTLPRLWD